MYLYFLDASDDSWKMGISIDGKKKNPTRCRVIEPATHFYVTFRQKAWHIHRQGS
jgi:hypothetical protein